jgi:hypothetical protein
MHNNNSHFYFLGTNVFYGTLTYIKSFECSMDLMIRFDENNNNKTKIRILWPKKIIITKISKYFHKLKNQVV